MPSEGPGPGPGAALGPGVPVEGGGRRRLHVLSPVFFATGHALRLWPLGVLVAARRQFWLLAVGALVLLAWSTLEWLRRTYELEGGALRLEQGVLTRKLRVVLFRKPLHRLLGVATLRVETAGGGKGAEVDLDVVTLAEARDLRATLLRAKARAAAKSAAAGSGAVAGSGAWAGPGAAAGAVDGPARPGSGSATLPVGGPPAPVGGSGAPAGIGAGAPTGADLAAPPAERVLLRLGLGEVMLAGITGSRAAAALVVLGPISQASD